MHREAVAGEGARATQLSNGQIERIAKKGPVFTFCYFWLPG